MNLTIKDVPEPLHRKLKSQAAANKRSLNGEVTHILEQAVESQPRDVESILADIRKIHARLNVPPLTEEFLQAAKRHGRS